ncbi:hypothetical protein [Nonomuraea sp. NPDC050202]
MDIEQPGELCCTACIVHLGLRLGAAATLIVTGVGHVNRMPDTELT